MARKRPTASDVPPRPADVEAPRPARGQTLEAAALSHAQAHALRRCTPLTRADFQGRPSLGVPERAPTREITPGER